jgi:NitT/TauT family transport system substrate-binding protein
MLQLALGAIAWSGGGRTAAAQGAAPKLQVAGPPTEDSTDLYYGIKTGLFRRAGLNVEMINTSSGAAATEAVIAGAYPLCKTNLLSVVQAHVRGIPVVLVAPEILYNPRNPTTLLQIAPDATYKTGADLNGKTAGVPALHAGAALMTCAWIDKHGGDWKSVRFVEISNSAMEPAIVSHRIDVGVLQPPQLDASLANGTTKTLGDCMGAIAPNYMYSGYIARADWAREHGDLIRTFARALAEATRYVNVHAAETAQLVAEFTKIEITDVAKMHRTINGTILDAPLVQPFIDAAAKYGEIPQAFPARDLIWTTSR